jgi:RimJ/RimL family protein N-acetyltransferase
MFRPARAADAMMVLSWRNHPIVRERSFTMRVIDDDEHRAWWHAALEDPARHLFIYERDGTPAGVVTYDQSGDGCVWGFYLDLVGIGEGPDQLRAWVEIFDEGIALAFDDLGVMQLHGEVLTANRGVRAIHGRFGFVESEPFQREVDGEAREAVHMQLTPDRRRTRRTDRSTR